MSSSSNNCNPIVDHFVKQYNMLPHIEGGYYCEIFRNPTSYFKKMNNQSSGDENSLSEQDNGERSLSTSIFYLLGGADFSCFHSIQSFEQWHYYSGSCNLIIHVLDPHSKRYGKFLLNNKPQLSSSDVAAAVSGDEKQKKDLLTPNWGIAGDCCSTTDLSCFISKDWWFAAELQDKSPENYVMAGCTVSYGFDFRDFKKGRREELIAEFCLEGTNDREELEKLITRLTRD